MKFYSQHGEDAWIAEHIKLPERGTFAEIGAFDGVMSSNTLYFENLGWTGFCVEADPHNAWKCAQNRKAKTVCCAVGRTTMTHSIYPFYVNVVDRGLSGLEQKGVPIFVSVIPLEYIGPSLGFPQVDLLSIDTEGTELDVLKSTGAMRPLVIIAEYRTCDEPPKDKELVEFCNLAGYREVHRTHCNLIFLRNV